MGHCIHALIAKTDILTPLKQQYTYAHLINLPQGFSLIPLIGELYDEIPTNAMNVTPPKREEHFKYDLEKISSIAERTSKRGPVAYIETDYAGGVGSQCAVVWENGIIVNGQLTTDNLK